MTLVEYVISDRTYRYITHCPIVSEASAVVYQRNNGRIEAYQPHTRQPHLSTLQPLKKPSSPLITALKPTARGRVTDYTRDISTLSTPAPNLSTTTPTLSMSTPNLSAAPPKLSTSAPIPSTSTQHVTLSTSTTLATTISGSDRSKAEPTIASSKAHLILNSETEQTADYYTNNGSDENKDQDYRETGSIDAVPYKDLVEYNNDYHKKLLNVISESNRKRYKMEKTEFTTKYRTGGKVKHKKVTYPEADDRVNALTNNTPSSAVKPIIDDSPLKTTTTTTTRNASSFGSNVNQDVNANLTTTTLEPTMPLRLNMIKLVPKQVDPRSDRLDYLIADDKILVKTIAGVIAGISILAVFIVAVVVKLVYIYI